MQNYSMLDLAPVSENSNVSDALNNTLDLAIYAEECGYHRYWLAEHHNMPGIASAATSVVISRVASKTSTIRVGAGGVMLPNHSPLVIAEQFGTLESFFPNRIDLGLGRAPGSDQLTARALRKKSDNNQHFPSDVLELISYLSDTPNNNGVTAIPGIGTNVPVWILGSSLYGAELAAHFGLPYAFASHFAPALLEKALHVYRSTFNPSKWASKPNVMICAGVCAAEQTDEALFLRSSQMISFANLMMGKPSKLAPPNMNIKRLIPPVVLAQVEQTFSCSAVGDAETIEKQIKSILDRFQPDELMITGAIYDHDMRKRSFGIASEVLTALKPI